MKKDTKKPDISVIVTTYNRKDLLKETIDSILNQTFRNFELIVVDNFSDYDFISHIKSLNDSRIIPFQNRNNRIIAVNRNYGIRRAKGKYIAFCDDDDLWLPKKLEEQIKHFNDESIIGVGTEMIIIGDTSQMKQKFEDKKNQLLDFSKIITFQSVPLSSLMVRNTGSLFDEDESFLAVEDFDFQLNLTLQTKKIIKKLSIPLIYYRVNCQGRNSGLQQKINSLQVIQKYEGHLSDDMKKNIYHIIYYRIGKKKLDAQLVRDSRKDFKKSLRYSLFNGEKSWKCVLGLLISCLPIYLKRKIDLISQNMHLYFT